MDFFAKQLKEISNMQEAYTKKAIVLKDSPDELGKQLANLSDSEIKEYAKEYLKRILSNISKVSEKIEYAKNLSHQASNVKNDLLDTINPFADSENTKRSRLNTRAISMQNEAMTEMNELIQSSTALIMCNMAFSQHVIEEISLMIAQGFLDGNGNMQRVSGQTKKLAKTLRDNIVSAVNHRMGQEKELNMLKKEMERQEEIDSKHSEEIESIKDELEKRKAKLAEIDKNSESIKDLRSVMEAQDELDKALENEIKTLKDILGQRKLMIEGLQSKLAEKDKLDDQQTQEIKELREEIRAKNGILSLSVAITALAMGVVNLVLFFTKGM